MEDEIKLIEFLASMTPNVEYSGLVSINEGVIEYNRNIDRVIFENFTKQSYLLLESNVFEDIVKYIVKILKEMYNSISKAFIKFLDWILGKSKKKSDDVKKDMDDIKKKAKDMEGKFEPIVRLRDEKIHIYEPKMSVEELSLAMLNTLADGIDDYPLHELAVEEAITNMEVPRDSEMDHIENVMDSQLRINLLKKLLGSHLDDKEELYKEIYNRYTDKEMTIDQLIKGGYLGEYLETSRIIIGNMEKEMRTIKKNIAKNTIVKEQRIEKLKDKLKNRDFDRPVIRLERLRVERYIEIISEANKIIFSEAANILKITNDISNRISDDIALLLSAIN